jgi:putative addiction module CopG family antidote
MSSGLSPENEQFIQHELECGAYASREELVDEAIRLLKRRRELERDIQAGINSGPFIPGEEVFARLEKRIKDLGLQAS